MIAFADVEIEPGHQIERLSHEPYRHMLVRRMLRATTIGMGYPYSREPERLRKDVVRERAAGIRDDGRRLAAAALDRRGDEADPRMIRIEPRCLEVRFARLLDHDLA